VCWEYRAKIGSVLGGLHSDRAAQRFAMNLGHRLSAIGDPRARVWYCDQGAPVPAPAVALAFILGGVFILWAERRKHVIRVQTVDDLTWRDALKLGFAQAFALIPGTSRSGATIIGGLFCGLSRKAATEFSFFLAIPR